MPTRWIDTRGAAALTLASLLLAAPASAQPPAPGVWFGIFTLTGGGTRDERFEIEAVAGDVVLFSAPFGKRRVNWGSMVAGSDGSTQFHWAGSASMSCAMIRDAQGDYTTTCRSAGPDSLRLTLTTKEPSHGSELAVTDADFKILARARTILSAPSAWNRHDDGACEDDVKQQSFSLFCALYQASLDVAGTYLDRRPVTTEIRAAVAEIARGRRFEQPLRDWSNLESTTFADLATLFERAQRRLEARKADRLP